MTDTIETDGRALVDAAVAQLEHAIVTGELRPGQKLSEQALSTRLGIGRGPLREAIRTLEGRRLVERKAFAGARVTDLSVDEIEQLLVMREALEGMASRHAAENMTLRETRALRASMEALAKRLRAGDIDALFFEKADNDFHQQVARGSRNRFLEEMICRDLYPLLRIFRYRTTAMRERGTAVGEEHTAILDAIERRDADDAERLMRQHIAAARERLIQTMRGAGAPAAAR